MKELKFQSNRGRVFPTNRRIEPSTRAEDRLRPCCLGIGVPTGVYDDRFSAIVIRTRARYVVYAVNVKYIDCSADESST